MRQVLIGLAAVALAAGPALAQGNGKGGRNGGGNGGGDHAGHAMQAGNPGKGSGGGGNGGTGGNGGNDAKRDRNAERGNGGQQAQRGNGGGHSNGAVVAQARGPEKHAERAEVRGRGRDDRGHGARAERQDDDRRNVANRRGDDRVERTVVVDRRGNGDGPTVRFDDDRDLREVFALNSRRIIDGCPPGLAKKNPPCIPPGQVRNNDGFSALYQRPDFWGLGGLNDGHYAYNDGYLVRLGSDGRAQGFVPLLAGALGIGNPWPSYYQPAPLPNYYESYYGLGQDNAYRYADNVIYRVDPQTSLINSVAALLTGDNFAVGQPLPLGYDAYNVPYPYRNQYADGPDAMYRYSDGYVYEVDPTTQLISAVIELLV